MSASTHAERAPSAAPSALARLWTPRLQVAYAGLVYLAIAIWLTWPMPEHIGSLIYGGTGDPIGSLANLRELVERNQPPFLPGTIDDFNAPEGLAVPWIRSLASISGQLIIWSLAMVFGPLAALNIFILSGFVLSGVAAMLLARRLTGSAGAGFAAGLALAFYPYAVAKAHGHYEFAHSWPIVLALWRMLELQWEPTRRNGVFAGLAVVVAMTFTPYYILLAGILYLTCAIAGLVASRGGNVRAALAAQAWAGGIVLVYLMFFRVLASASEAGQGLRTNTDAEFNAYSARLYEYLFPHADSVLFGDWTGGWLADHIHGSNSSESTLYVGIVVLALAGAAIVLALLRRLTPRLRQVTWTLVAVAIVAGLCSAPPRYQAAGLSIPMPTEIITAITPTWRVFARFVIVIEVALVLLAAIGLAQLTARLRPQARAVVIALVAVLLLVDLSPSGGGSNPIGVPSIYRALDGLPEGIVAEYPLVPAKQSVYDELLAQDFHDMPLLNGYESGSKEEARAIALGDPSAPQTGDGLAALGVKYALIRAVPANKDLPEPSSDFRLIAQDSTGRLFAVQPRGAAGVPPSIVSLGEGFEAPEDDGKSKLQWLSADRGEIDVRARCSDCRGTVHVIASSFARPRRVTITGGTRPVSVEVVEDRDIAVPVRFDRSTRLTVTTDPGPEPVQGAIPSSPDKRSLSINLRAPRLELTR
jgi:hypothetical protein